MTGVYGMRNVVWPTSGTALPSCAGDDAERVQVRGLALVGRHAGRRVALDVLDRAEAFARREREVPRRDVVLEIDEGLRTAAGRLRRGDARGVRQPLAAAHLESHRGRRVSARARRGEPRGCAVRERGREAERRRGPHPPGVRARPIDDGTKARAASLQVSLPRDCEKRCTAGA